MEISQITTQLTVNLRLKPPPPLPAVPFLYNCRKGTTSHHRQAKFSRMTLLKRYVLRLFISLKYITANVVDRNNGRIVATASTVEHSLKNSLECGRSCNAKAAAVVGEVLAMRLKVEGLEQGQGRGIHADVNKEIEKKGLKNSTKVWSIVNALKNNGVKLILEENDKETSCSSYKVHGADDFRNRRD
ncbi:unnamed protein product [Fraxinus pennsylvanica]|uniref:Ribosomal protein L18 n=1 Tax=Fraxinus pennsylvanica TaxID=56036 RepID=A0AAD1ZYZ5_9LAMI|nr:unnamed protein product [Fraxinus pennsylvanica]